MSTPIEPPAIEWIVERLAASALSSPIPPGTVPAAVLVPLYRDGPDWSLLFIRRTDRVSTHKGQIAFPGGRRDPEDADWCACALRETREEVGIAAEEIRILGELPFVTTTHTGFTIRAVVGLLPGRFDPRPNPEEVAELLSVPFAFFFDPSACTITSTWDQGRERHSYHYRYGDNLIWGATAAILHQLISLLAPG
ncbi:MAG: CoA pyrophosphatase [Magnetococcales bacterium]|nr:CoA pyrophosphatase [Magnetococcales bacterium]MBF0157689.1 CoA pyrophosphatase [Magnetococcales bacterium]